jgi:hypothetical protein
MTYLDALLPFGWRSNSKIFTGIANVFEWVLTAAGVPEMDHAILIIS